ncbi:hypothetical protein KBA27_00950 [bacterium]|nr:hypothetical protein [bacterium]
MRINTVNIYKNYPTTVTKTKPSFTSIVSNSKLTHNEVSFSANSKLDNGNLKKTFESLKNSKALKFVTSAIVAGLAFCNRKSVYKLLGNFFSKNKEIADISANIVCPKNYELSMRGEHRYLISTDAINTPKKLMVNNIYSNLGVLSQNVLPDFSMGLEPKSYECIFIENTKKIPDDKSVYSKISKDFSADVVVANQNILDSCKINNKGIVYRLKLANTLENASQNSASNLLSRIPTEMTSFLDFKKNPQNAKVYSVMTKDDFVKSLKNLENVSKSSICKSVIGDFKTNKMKQYEEIMQDRMDFLQKSIDIAKTTEKSNLSLLDFAKQVQNKTLKVVVQEAEDYRKLNDIERVIIDMDNSKDKEELLNLYNNRIKELTSDKTKMSFYEAGKILKNYTTGLNKISDKKKEEIINQFGEEIGEIYIKNLEKPLENLKCKQFARIANSAGGKYREFCEKNPEKIVAYLNGKTLENMDIVNFKDKEWNTVLESYVKIFDNKNANELLHSIDSYKGYTGYDQINGIARTNYFTDKIIEKIEKKGLNISQKDLKDNIEKLGRTFNRMNLGNTFDVNRTKDGKSYIYQALSVFKTEALNPQDLSKIKSNLSDLKAFVNEFAQKSQYGKDIKTLKNNFLVSTEAQEGLKLNRNETSMSFYLMEMLGEDLSKLMVDDTKKDEVLKYLNEKHPDLHCPAFISTSIAPYRAMSGNVEWSLTLGKGVKYMYIEDLEKVFCNGFSNTEAELLVDSGNKINITGAKKEGNIWKLSGTILPDEAK